MLLSVTISDVVVVFAVGQQPVTWSSWRNQNTSSSTKTTDAMQIFLERAEKSGIKLEAVPESYVWVTVLHSPFAEWSWYMLYVFAFGKNHLYFCHMMLWPVPSCSVCSVRPSIWPSVLLSVTFHLCVVSKWVIISWNLVHGRIATPF